MSQPLETLVAPTSPDANQAAPPARPSTTMAPVLDRLRTARGLLLGLAISIGFWIVVAAVILLW